MNDIEEGGGERRNREKARLNKRAKRKGIGKKDNDKRTKILEKRKKGIKRGKTTL